MIFHNFEKSIYWYFVIGILLLVFVIGIWLLVFGSDIRGGSHWEAPRMSPLKGIQILIFIDF